MLTKLQGWPILPFLAALSCASGLGQQMAFTSRAYVQSPIVITSVESSKEFGFDSVALKSDGPNAISAVHFQIICRTSAGDEIVDERRVAVNLEPRGSQHLQIGLAHVQGLKQLARSRNQASALVILTVESVEFKDGSEWKQTERDGGIPLDPQQPPQGLKPRR
jgi:hypothetical protein